MESFGARFPHIYTDSGFKGWFVSTLLLGQLRVYHSYGSRESRLTCTSCMVRISH